MYHFSQISEHSIMIKQIHARLNLSIITLLNAHATEEIVQHCTLNVIYSREKLNQEVSPSCLAPGL